MNAILSPEKQSTRKTVHKMTASLSLDLDNKWSYMKTHGDAGWEKWPSYLHIVVPRVLEFLKQRNLSITWFIVGQDAAMPEHHAILKSIVEAGHEVGNHSYQHEPWLHLYPEAEIEAELSKTEIAIENATGVIPKAFRGPGFSLSPTVLKVLERRGYEFDCSTFPTYLGPLARAYYFMTAKLPEEEKAKRSLLFGKISDGLRSLKSYNWTWQSHDSANQQPHTLLEIPVTTMPLFKVPMHLSYLLYLSKFSFLAAKLYFRTALLMCKITRTQPSILLHPLDFMGCDDDSDLSFFPAMDITSGKKLQWCDTFFKMLTDHFDCVPMGEHARRLKQSSQPSRRFDF